MQGRLGPPPIEYVTVAWRRQPDGRWCAIVHAKRVGSDCERVFKASDMSAEDAREALWTELDHRLP
jgi:hypothetical protein